MQNFPHPTLLANFPPSGTLLIVKLVLDTYGWDNYLNLWAFKHSIPPLEKNEVVLFLGLCSHTIDNHNFGFGAPKCTDEFGFKILNQEQVIGIGMSPTPLTRFHFDNMFSVYQR